MKAPSFLATLRLLMPSPPATAAVSLLLEGQKISSAQQKAIASAFFHFIGRLLPDDFARDEILVSPALRSCCSKAGQFVDCICTPWF